MIYKKKTITFKKILEHPDKNAIIRMLSRGMGVREVAKRIQELQPNNKKLWITPTTLQKFRNQKLNLDGEALNVIKQAEKEKREIKDGKKEDTKIKKLGAYKEQLHEALGLHIDIRQSLANMYKLIDSRMEELYERGSLSINEDMNLQKYLQTYLAVIEKWAKYIDKIADQTIETNVNITVIEDQVSIIRECIRETFNEVNPELAIKFFEKLERKMSQLSYKAKRPTSFNEISQDVQILAIATEGSENDS